MEPASHNRMKTERENIFRLLNEKQLPIVGGYNQDVIIKDLVSQFEKLEAENDKKTEALESIDRWVKAYPLDIFQKPDLKKAAKVLKVAGMTLDAISADAMRHVLDGIKDIVKQALRG